VDVFRQSPQPPRGSHRGKISKLNLIFIPFFRKPLETGGFFIGKGESFPLESSGQKRSSIVLKKFKNKLYLVHHIGSSIVHVNFSIMGNLKKKRRLKMNKHKRSKRSKANRHKKRLWGA
jgi:hypothetical protein